MEKWDNVDLDRMWEARWASKFSPDPSMKCGTVIYQYWPDGSEELVGTGWNDMPVGCSQEPEVWERPLKYERVVHGEVNAVLDAGHDAEGGVAYCWPPGLGPACSRCASVMIQAGITKVYYVDKGSFSSEKWNEPVQLGNKMFGEAEVELVGIPIKVFNTHFQDRLTAEEGQ